MFGPVYSIFKEDYAGFDANKIKKKTLLKPFSFRGFQLGVRCKDKQTLQNREQGTDPLLKSKKVFDRLGCRGLKRRVKFKGKQTLENREQGE